MWRECREPAQIVASARDPETKKPKTRIIAHLGQVASIKEKDVDNIINGLCRAVGRPTAEDIDMEYAHDFGHIWAIVQIWKHLKIGFFLERRARQSGATFDLAQHILLMCANRLCDPRRKQRTNWPGNTVLRTSSSWTLWPAISDRAMKMPPLI
ncbi:MAG: hypothetical protein ACLFOY_03725 [Desulfatibacillaceae bacterium]